MNSKTVESLVYYNAQINKQSLLLLFFSPNNFKVAAEFFLSEPWDSIHIFCFESFFNDINEFVAVGKDERESVIVHRMHLRLYSFLSFCRRILCLFF